MSDILKCPFCKRKLQYDDLLCSCINEHCEESFDMVGTELLWKKVIDLKQEIDGTRKALDVAKNTFNWIDETYRTGQETEAEIWGKVQLAAQEITALEQKD